MVLLKMFLSVLRHEPIWINRILVDQVMTCSTRRVKQRVDFVGPQVGQELATKGALGYSCFFVSNDDLYCHAF